MVNLSESTKALVILTLVDKFMNVFVHFADMKLMKLKILGSVNVNGYCRENWLVKEKKEYSKMCEDRIFIKDFLKENKTKHWKTGIIFR